LPGLRRAYLRTQVPLEETCLMPQQVLRDGPVPRNRELAGYARGEAPRADELSG